MRVSNTHSAYSTLEASVVNFDFLEQAKQRKPAQDISLDPQKQREEAQKKVEEAKEKNTQESLRILDKHHKLIADSQKFYKEKELKKKIETATQEDREQERALLAEMALNNAKRELYLKE